MAKSQKLTILLSILCLTRLSQAKKVDISKYFKLDYELPKNCFQDGSDCMYREPFGFLLKNETMHCPAIFENYQGETDMVLTELSTDMCGTKLKHYDITGSFR